MTRKVNAEWCSVCTQGNHTFRQYHFHKAPKGFQVMVNAIDYTQIVKRVQIVTAPSKSFGENILQYNIYTYMLDVDMGDYGTGKCEMVFNALGNIASFHIFEKDNLAHINLNKLFLMELPYKRMGDRGNIQQYYRRKFI